MNNSFFNKSLNERLAIAGSSQAFSQAVRQGNQAEMKRILRTLSYDDASADAMVRTFVSNPSAYQG